MHIIHIATECSPIAKAGGLGDVVYGLSKALVKLGHTVEIILPKYNHLTHAGLKNLHISHRNLTCPYGSSTIQNTVWSAEMHQLPIHLIESEHPDAPFSRGTIYGCVDDTARFAYFSKVAVEYLIQSNKTANIIHVHDWPTALVPLLLKQTVLNIHNLEHQGLSSPTELSRLHIATPGSEVNFLKMGIEHADQVVTVSPQYKEEILTPLGGCSLHTTLLQNQHKLHGILNGIDEDYWNPQTDPYLLSNYSASDPLPSILLAKKDNRRHLCRYLNLQETGAPLVIAITRLASQKSPPLIIHALKRTLELGGQFILLGSHPDPAYAQLLQDTQKACHNNLNAAFLLGHDEALAHLLFAAADAIIIPSLFEPCGLTQMIGMRYGTIPIARLTGGLTNTVFDADTSKKPNGFTFEYPDEAGVNWALDRALQCIGSNATQRQKLLLNGMKHDWSWKERAPQYVQVYQTIAQTPCEDALDSHRYTQILNTEYRSH